MITRLCGREGFALKHSSLIGIPVITCLFYLMMQTALDAAPPSAIYRIESVATGRLLRIRTGRDNVLYAVDNNREDFPNDKTTQFTIEAYPDGSYRIRSVATGKLIYTDAKDNLLSTRTNAGDQSAKVTFEPAGTRRYRIKFASNGQFWHEDGLGDRQISTRWGARDEYTVFRLMAANSTPTNPIPANLLDSSGGMIGGAVAPVTARRPVDANSNIRFPTIIPYVNSDDSLDVAWTSATGETILSSFSGGQWKNGNHIKISNALPILAGFTKDSQGNRYLMTGTGEKVVASMNPNARRKNILNILKLPPGSQSPQLFVDLNQESYYRKWGIYNPLLVSPSDGRFSVRSQLVHGNGVLTASFAHNIPGADGYVHDTMCILAVNTAGQSVFREGGGMHCGDLQTIYDGRDFVQAQAHERGIVLSKLSPGSNGQMSWSDHKLVFKNDHHELLLGGLVQTPSGYLVVFSHPNFGVNPENGLPVWFVSIPKNFESLPNWRWPNKTEVYSDEVRSFKLAMPPQNPGRRDSYERPRVAPIGNQRYAVLWEYLINGEYQNTYSIIVDQYGQALSNVQLISDSRIHNSNNAFQFPASGKVGWISGDATSASLILHTLDQNLNSAKYSLSVQ
ncbi:RICIN domain-containing protein [Rubinisphaera italica]|nr:RICIN domain-containing protein [Rubinisphaera italica]